MLTYLPPDADTLVLSDVRTLADAHRDAKSGATPGNQSVHETHALALEVFGARGWAGVARAALFEFGQKVTAAARAKAREELEVLLRGRQWKYIVVLQSRSKAAKKSYTDDYAEASHSGTLSWSFFKPPAPIHEMCGTFWQTPYGTVLGLPDTVGAQGYLMARLVVRWLTAVREQVPLFLPPPETTHTEAGQGMALGLTAMLASAQRGVPIAVDIESYSTKDLITVLGLSDGTNTCAVPWEPFSVYGKGYVEPGEHLSSKGQLARRILQTAKTVIMHNGERFDAPYLARKGIRLPGQIFDTYIMSGVLLNQYRHGLQHCVSAEFVVPPWKSLHRQQAETSGLDAEDADAWVCDPHELRTYNASDTMYTWWLGQQYAEYAGEKL